MSQSAALLLLVASYLVLSSMVTSAGDLAIHQTETPEPGQSFGGTEMVRASLQGPCWVLKSTASALGGLMGGSGLQRI